MSKISRYILIVCMLVTSVSVVYSQQRPDSTQVDSGPLVLRSDVSDDDGSQASIVLADTTTLEVQDLWQPDPMRAVWMGAIIPGYGQIYNRAYWKLPIVYGGFLGCAYAISWNNVMYNDYRGAYYDIIDSDPLTDSYLDILPDGYTVESLGGMSAYEQVLKTKQQSFRRYRDMSILITIAFYALTLVDAYVDASLYDFDITPDLSLQLQPAVHTDVYNNNQKSAELQMSLKF